MVENILLADKHYPGWIVRVHYNDTVPLNIIQWIDKQNNTELVHHIGHEKTAMNTFWRFNELFIDDAITIVRDADSRISEREVSLVNEWLKSDKDFHIIRDNPAHTVPIMAGMFGMRNNCLNLIPLKNKNTNINGPQYDFIPGDKCMELFIQQNKNIGYNVDQIFLGLLFYPMIVMNSFIHTSHNDFEPFCVKIEPVEVGFCGEVICETPNASKIFNDSTKSFIREGVY